MILIYLIGLNQFKNVYLGRFRVDLIWLLRSFYCAKNDDERLKYEHLSQEWKLIIEKLQRDEREYKAKMNKIREKEMKKKKR